MGLRRRRRIRPDSPFNKHFNQDIMEEGWMEVFLTAHDYKAAMAKDILENEGIRAIVINQHDSSYPSFGESVVYVQEADKEKALELLKELKH